MNRERLTSFFVLAVLIGCLSTARAQTPSVPAQAADGNQVYSKEDQELAANSKKAIIETGISEPYFKEHFRLARVVNEAGDRHIEWKYSINEYETMLVDDVGYYTSEAGARTDVHSIKSELFSAYDIKQTIPRNKAEAALQSCIGEHRDTQVVFRALKAPGKAGLYLTARSVTVTDDEEEREKEKKKEPEREVEGITFNVGFIDLENGKCSIVRGQVTP